MKVKVLLITLCMVLINQCAMASRLPDDFWNYLKKQFPNSTQRFDSLIVLADGTTYIPLYPAQTTEEKTINVEYTYPAGKSLASKPEVVIFNNNYVLLKLLKDKNGNFSITKNEDLPLKVKLGVMPQDMLVPVGLQVPDSLKLILGDLVIPQKGDNLITTSTDAKIDSRKDEKAQLFPLNELKNKKTIISTDKSKFVLVYNGEAGNDGKNSLYELKLNGLPSKILASNKSKFALVMYFGSKTLEVVDLTNERMVAQINLDDMPKDADLDTVNNIAYVASANASTVYAIDLNAAKLMKSIKLEQSPYKIAVSNDGESLGFIDRNTQKVYSLKPNNAGEGYIAKYIAEGKNLSRILYKDDKIYTISRTENLLSVYNEPDGVLTEEIKLNEKPVDAVFYHDKIYILCAKDSIINVYDTKNGKIVENIMLDNSGFYSKITMIPNQPNALITGIQTKKFLLLNLDKMIISKKQNTNINVSNIIIVDNAAPSREETKEAL